MTPDAGRPQVPTAALACSDGGARVAAAARGSQRLGARGGDMCDLEVFDPDSYAGEIDDVRGTRRCAEDQDRPHGFGRRWAWAGTPTDMAWPVGSCWG
jgi:hypothetical protein